MGGQKTKLNESNERIRNEIQARIDDMVLEAGYNTPDGEKNYYVLSKLDALQSKLKTVSDGDFDHVVSDVLTAMAKLDLNDLREHHPLHDVVATGIEHYVKFIPLLIKDAEASGDQEALQRAVTLSEDILELEDSVSLVPTEQQIAAYRPIHKQVNIEIVQIQEIIAGKHEEAQATEVVTTSSASSASSTMFRGDKPGGAESVEKKRRRKHRSDKSSSRSPATTRRTSGRR